MLINPVCILLVTTLLVFSHIVIQQQKLRKINECCICRRSITKNEEIVICSDCQTIYHHKHLSLWLKIRKQCPICKRRIGNHNIYSFDDIKAFHSAISKDISKNRIISNQRKQKGKIRPSYIRGDSFVLECPHCKNILDSLTYKGLSQCQMCGSRISWINDLVSSIKNLNNLTHDKKKRIRIKNFCGNRGKNDRRISFRNIQRQKERKRKFFQKELQKQAEMESQDQILLLNKDYLKRQTQLLGHKQYIPLRIIEFEDKKENLRKTNFFELENVMMLIMVITLIIFVTILV